MKKTGTTTRTIDEAIQKFFTHDEIINYYSVNSKVGDIGEVVEGDDCKIEFRVPEFENDTITKAISGCGCTKAKIRDGGTVVAIFKTPDIPKHLPDQDTQKFSKRIYLEMYSGEKHTLEFHRTKIRRK